MRPWSISRYSDGLRTNILLGCFIHRSNVHLEEVDRAATKMYDRLTTQLAEQEGIAEQLKTTDQWEWVQQMNNIRNRAEEIVRKEFGKPGNHKDFRSKGQKLTNG